MEGLRHACVAAGRNRLTEVLLQCRAQRPLRAAAWRAVDAQAAGELRRALDAEPAGLWQVNTVTERDTLYPPWLLGALHVPPFVVAQSPTGGYPDGARQRRSCSWCAAWAC